MSGILNKYYWIALIYSMYLTSGVVHSQTTVTDKIPLCDNFLYIRGESNINEFTFYYNSVPENPSKSNSSDSMKISIPVKDFEASNTMMYKDFLVLMKESSHPRIYVTFSLKQLEDAIKNEAPCPEIRITIAGVTRTYLVDCLVEKCSGKYYLKGREIVKLSDFNLKPPERLMGLVKVNNEIDVNFGFIITFTNYTKFSAVL